MKTLRLFSPLILLTLLLAFGSCQKAKFHISGHITEASDSTLYLEQLTLEGVVTIDSAKLSKEGNFEFAQDAVKSPEFYQLRIAGRAINLAVDSTETISVEAEFPSMWYDYKVEGSDDCLKIKELALKQMDLQGRINALVQSPQLSVDSTQVAIIQAMTAFKEEVKRNYIFPQPMKSYAYYALFQTVAINGQPNLIFNPRESKEDVKVYAAVATSWDTYYPEAERGQNLHNIAIEGMKNIRIIENNRRQAAEVSAAEVTQTGIIDMPLTDNRGQQRSLTALKGQVVLIDFHVFASEQSTPRIMALRELYNKYHARGLEIYQVSLDQDEHFWKTKTAALPWISVRDDRGVSNTYLQATGGQLPCYFLVSRDNNVAAGPQQIKDIEKDIESLL